MAKNTTPKESEEQIHLMKLAAACFNKILEGKAPEVQQQLFNMAEYTKRNTNNGFY